MPLPLLFIGIAAVTGALGIGKSVKAAIDTSDANDANKRANAIISDAQRKLEIARRKSKKSLEDLGRAKLRILNGCVTDFVNTFKQLKNVEFQTSTGLNELHKFAIDKQGLKELEKMGGYATSVLGGIGGGALGGALTAFGAYSAAGTFAAASTGTAIASLSGAAATNATLAFFGGGSLAAGGLGMAGGTMVLGGLVAGPALAIMGFIVGAKASTEKNKAYANLATAKKNAHEMDLASEMCYAIAQRSDMFANLLAKLKSYAQPLIETMKSAIIEHGTDYRLFSDEEKKSVAACVAVVKSIKSVLDTPILTKEGNLTWESKKLLQEVKAEPSE